MKPPVKRQWRSTPSLKRTRDQLRRGMPKSQPIEKPRKSYLLTLHGKQIFDPSRFRWPAFLYIPKNADASHYWISPAPDDHRYALDWTSPPTATANRASREDGSLFSFSQLVNEKPGSAQSSECGVGIFYQPTMTLGVVDLQPQVDCSGTLRTFLEFFSGTGSWLCRDQSLSPSRSMAADSWWL